MLLGFFGGSFDPPHRGHLAVARAAAQRFGLDEVIFAPVGLQPLKGDGARAGFADRVEMVRLLCAVADDAEPRAGATFSVTDLDGPRPDGGANYTVDALTALAARHPRAELFNIVGADSFLDLRRWHQPERLLMLADWIVVSRPDVPMGKEALAGLGLTAEQRERVHLLSGIHEPVSATALRARLAAGEECHSWLPEPVLSYIREHGLYGTTPL